ncbi:MAG: hypothetical protein IT581_11065 [Verrucomicrobiales bacterium]|nr:hypothetical protein [Verrucomicrobiales bacterium]
MRHSYLFAAGLLRCLVTLLRPGGARALVAENHLLRQQLNMLRRSRRRAPNLSPVERLLADACSILLYPRRLARAAVIFRPSTLSGIHRALVRRKYRNLFRSRREFLDHTLFWNDTDLTRKLAAFVDYCNRDRAHAGVHGQTPAEAARATAPILADFRSYGWKSCCGGFFQLPSPT